MQSSQPLHIQQLHPDCSRHCRAAQDWQAAWAHAGAGAAAGTGREAKQQLLVLLGRNDAQMRSGAATAAAAGHEHAAILQGGLPAFDAADLAQVRRCVAGMSDDPCAVNLAEFDLCCAASVPAYCSTLRQATCLKADLNG